MRRESRRRQEASVFDDDHPMRPPARAGIVPGHRRVNNPAALPMTSLYPTSSNLQRHGVTLQPAPVNEGDGHQIPRELSVPRRRPHLSRTHSGISQVTMPIDLHSFDGTEFEQIPPSDDYLDDEELELYLKQLAKEEEMKKQEKESIRQLVSNERESLHSLLCAMDGPSDFCTTEHNEEYLERLIEEQLQIHLQFNSNHSVGLKRISEGSR